MLRLPGCRFPCGDDADDTLLSVTVTNQQQAKRTAEPQQHKSVFGFRMVWIINQARSLVEKHGLRLFKGDAMFLQIGYGLTMIPFESQGTHVISVITS